MITSDTARLAARNLRESKLRTLLTALGIAIGIGALVCMMSFGVAVQDQVITSFMRSGLFDSITVTSPFSPLARRQQGNAERKPAAGGLAQIRSRVRLDDDALAAIRKIDKVKEVYPDIRVPVQVVYGQVSEVSTARGVAMSSRGEGGFQQMPFGHFFRSESDDACLVSLEFARRLDGEPKRLVGKEITLRYVSSAAGLNPVAMVMTGGLSIQPSEQRFRVEGIVERPEGPNFLAAFSGIMIPMAKARAMGGLDLSDLQGLLGQFGDKRSYTMATVKVQRPQDTEQVEKGIKAMGLTAFSIADVLESQKKAFVLFDLFLALVSSIALTVASLGIANTMVMSILERTREIGVMKAIGGSDRDVRAVFLIEAALIGLIGGVAGIGLGWAVGRAINIGANYYLSTQGLTSVHLFLIRWWLVAGAIAFAVLISLLAGHFPARRAARLDPIEALRHD